MCFDKYGRPIEDDEQPMADGDFIRVPMTFMDSTPSKFTLQDAAVRARDGYIQRLTGFAPRPAMQPVRDSTAGITDTAARRMAYRDDYVQRLGVIHG